MYMTVLAVCEPMATYISARLGAKRMHHSYDVEYQILKMKDTSLPRLIQKHFNLTDDLLQPPTYFRYILTYFLFLRMLLLFLLVLVLDAEMHLIVYVLCSAPLIIVTIPLIMFEMYCQFRVSKLKPKQKIKISNLSHIKEEIHCDIKHFKLLKEVSQEEKKQLWMSSLFNEIERCVRKQKKCKYLIASDLKYLENRVFPKYKKYINYVISLNSNACNSLFVFEKNTQTPIFSMEIKKR